jgi:hypothetical protein
MGHGGGLIHPRGLPLAISLGAGGVFPAGLADWSFVGFYALKGRK